MKLLTKFNLILLVIFGISGCLISEVIYSSLTANARREVMQQAELMMASAKAVRDYTSSDLKPLLEKNPQHKHKFLAETVPAFAAMTTFGKLRLKYADYTYREVALNPTNPEHRAIDWEADVIRYFREHPGQKDFTGERTTATGTSVYTAMPLTAEPRCMACHSRPAEAPSAMLATYGSNNGFGWKTGEVVAAQIVSVPMSVPLRSAREAFYLFLTYLLVTFIVTTLVLDVGVYFIVIRPLKLISDAADRISKGETNPAPLPVKGKDEIATMTTSFNRMQISLAKAFKMLG